MATFFETEDGLLVNLDNIAYIEDNGVGFTTGSENEQYYNANSVRFSERDRARIKRQFSGDAVASAIKSLCKSIASTAAD